MIIRTLAAVALLLGLPVVALGHEEHGGHGGHSAAKPAGPGAVVVGGYRVELLSEPAPLTAGRPSRLIAKLTTAEPPEPVSDASVQIGLAAVGTEPAPAPAPEETWVGHYTATVTPAAVGAYQVRVLVAEVDGRRLEPPLSVAFPLEIGRAPGLGWAVWAALALTGGIGLAGVYALRLRAANVVPVGAFDFLSIPWLKRGLTSPAFQPALQVPSLLLMVVVVVLGLADVQDGATNLATKLTWTIWWAGVIFTFVLFGRVWCVACPFGALNEWTSRVSGAWRHLPRPFRNIWWATGLFVLLTWADEQLGVVRSPRVTAWIVIAFAALAVLVGLRYARRSFCRHLCPIGGLIGIYSMTAPLELRAKDVATCRTHADKACYRGGGAGRGCPMFEFPQSLDRNNYCTLCAECVKGCGRDNLVLRLRAFGRDLWDTRKRLLDEAYLGIVLVALTLLVTAQMLPAWPGWISTAAGWLPGAVRSSLRPVTYLTLVESLLLLGGALVVAPVLVFGCAALANRWAGPAALGPRRTFVVFAYMFVPIGLGMHLAHNLSHLLLEGPGIVPVVQRAVALYTPLSLGQPDWQIPPLAGGAVVLLLQMTAVVGLFALSLVAGHRLSVRLYADRRTAWRVMVPFAVLSLLFTVAGIVLLSQPMGMRHGT